MKLSVLLCLCLLAQGVFPHMPTFYEFCSQVVANGEGGRATCDASQCQGRTGKVGPRGIPGLTGQKGEPSANIGPGGPRGIQGLKGQKGEKSAEIGPVGIQGSKGQKGEQSAEIGPVGIQGSKGQKGEQSTEIGPVGPVGIQGSKGQKGEQSTEIGPVGPVGIQGLKGQKGEKSAEIGPVGPRGIQGLKGQRGETGTSEEVEEKVRILEEFVNVLFFALAESPSTRVYLKALYVTLAGSSSTKESLKPVTETVCYMGMKSGQIPDSAITSSSDLGANWAAHLGRLDNRVSGSKYGAWIAKRNRVGEWIQVDLGQPEVVAGVVTQGRPVYNHWVTSYKVSCGNVASSMTTITEDGQDKVFSANTDRDTKVVNKFPQLMSCRYIRIYPQTYYSRMSMRLEIIRGICKDIY